MASVFRFCSRLRSVFMHDISETFLNSGSNERHLEAFVVAPYYAEKVFTYGMLICIDSFLFSATILPLRACSAFFHISHRLDDLLRFLTMVIVYQYLCTVKVSSIYHSFKNQPGMTVYVIYGVTDVCDKFLCTFGSAVGNCVVNTRADKGIGRALFFFFINLVYTGLHSFVLIWQFVTINIAVNSYKNALMSFILVHLFGKVRSIILKRFKYSTLTQTLAGDTIQRFKIGAIVSVIIMRNLFDSYTKNGCLSFECVKKICGPSVMLYSTNLFLDWMKYSYIASFNGMDPRAFFQSLLLDYRRENLSIPVQSARGVLAKQIGWPVAPMMIICVRMFVKGGNLRTWLTPFLYLGMLFVQCFSATLLRLLGEEKGLKKKSTEFRKKVESSLYSEDESETTK